MIRTALRRPLVLVGIGGVLLALLVAGLVLFVAGRDEEPQGGPTKPPAEVGYPADVLDLTNWKLTLPVDGDDDDRADEIRQPCLAVACYDPKRKMYANPEFKVPFSSVWFHVTDNSDGVVFRAPVNGATTSGSDNARSELRELAPADEDGDEVEARWSNKGSAVHTMELEQAIMSTPRRYPSVVTAQIHNDDDDVILIKYREGRLFADADRGDFDETLDENYRLGTRFKLRIQATQGEIRVTYNDTKTVVYEKASDTMYFKAGVYNQSNLEKYPDEAPNSYGEVVIYSLKVTHVGGSANADADEGGDDSDDEDD
ncbi:MAG TPA: polysaccharide lyase family 7 protein [Aeromicrobium sp.]|nr:polysaccharide lyase family 7 protein [Aeromicrobium sp.]